MTNLARRKNEVFQEVFFLGPYVHAAISADTTVKLMKLSRRMKIISVSYTNPTGLAENATNHLKVQIKNATTIAAEWDTNSAGAGDNGIPADSPINLILSATEASRVYAAGDVLSFAVDVTGIVTLPVNGVVVVEGIYF